MQAGCNYRTAASPCFHVPVSRKLGIIAIDACLCPNTCFLALRCPVTLVVTVQVIITTNNVLVMNPEDENVLPFITELKMKISQPSGLAGVRS
jgi:hypothetical protein